jgi:hypothetical protein
LIIKNLFKINIKYPYNYSEILFCNFQIRNKIHNLKISVKFQLIFNFSKQSGIDAHQLKRDFLGNKAKIAHYDLYKDNRSSEILILKKGGKGNPIKTGEYLK